MRLKFYHVLLVFAFLRSINAYTQGWSALSTGTNGAVFCLSLDTMVGFGNIGGSFTTAGSVGAKSVAQWTGLNWDSLKSGANGPIYCMINDGNLIVGGDFDSIGGVAAKNLATWDGTSWSELGGGLNKPVYAIENYNGNYFIGGAFDTIPSFPNAKYLAVWNFIGWQAASSFYWPSDTVFAIKHFNSKLYIGGSFTNISGIPLNHVAEWDGMNWNLMGSGVDAKVRAIETYNNELYIGGDFQLANGVTANHLAKWNGNALTSFTSGTNGSVFALKRFANFLIVGGSFSSAGGLPMDNITRWNNSTWQDLDGGTNGAVYSIDAFPFENKLYVGGLFSSAGTINTNNLAVWQPSVGLHNYEMQRIKAYPNPATDILKIEMLKKQVELRIVDILGNEVYHGKFSQQASIDVSNFPKGCYIAQLLNDNEVMSHIFIKE